MAQREVERTKLQGAQIIAYLRSTMDEDVVNDLLSKAEEFHNAQSRKSEPAHVDEKA